MLLLPWHCLPYSQGHPVHTMSMGEPWVLVESQRGEVTSLVWKVLERAHRHKVHSCRLTSDSRTPPDCSWTCCSRHKLTHGHSYCMCRPALYASSWGRTMSRRKQGTQGEFPQEFSKEASTCSSGVGISSISAFCKACSVSFDGSGATSSQGMSCRAMQPRPAWSKLTHERTRERSSHLRLCETASRPIEVPGVATPHWHIFNQD